MPSSLGHVRRGLAIAALWGAAGAAQAAIITLTGVNFDVRYDDTKLGLFGAPTLGGNDTLFFTLNTFAAQSTNGLGIQSTFSTISGIELVAKNSYQFGSLALSEFGDYLLQGANSTVAVAGALRAFNTANPINSQTNRFLTVNPATPLNINDGSLHDWIASSTITTATAPVLPTFLGGVNALANNARTVGITIENTLTAFTPPGVAPPQQAFIEKKFAGVSLVVTPIPEVPTPVLMLGGLALVGFVLRKKRATAA